MKYHTSRVGRTTRFFTFFCLMFIAEGVYTTHAANTGISKATGESCRLAVAALQQDASIFDFHRHQLLSNIRC